MSGNVPAIRFAGFTEPWEQRKFGALVLRASEVGSDPDLPHVEYEDIVPGQGALNKNLAEKRSDKTGILFEPGDVLYGKLRPYLMNWLYPQFKGIAVGDFWVLRPLDIDGSFLYRLIQNPDFQSVANVSAGSKMPRADWKLVSQRIRDTKRPCRATQGWRTFFAPRQPHHPSSARAALLTYVDG